MDTYNNIHNYHGIYNIKISKREDIPMEEERIEEGRLLIKEKYCIGCGICRELAPKYFKIENQKAIVINKDIEEQWEEKN